MKYDSIIIVGPTASGKTLLSIELAKTLKGEIVNADSQQIYKHLNIGTAKVTDKEKQGINHHLFDLIDVGEDFSVSEYKQLATQKIKELKSKLLLPIIVGGTGFYVESLLYNLDFGTSGKNKELRQKYEQLAQEHGNEYVHNILAQLDPKSANSLHCNDLKRVIRAIEIATDGKIKKSEQSKTPANLLHPLIIGLNTDREVLYNKINLRVEKMLSEGLFDEVIELKNNGYYDSNCVLPIGYSEWKEFFDNTKSKEEVVEKIKQDTRNYAKRQITWFKRLNCMWLDLYKTPINKAVEKVLNVFCE